MEHIIVSIVMSHFTHHDVLSDRQHGFRVRRSCESQLLSLTQELHEHLEYRNESVKVCRILNRFGMMDCMPILTPCEIDVNKIRYADYTELSNSRLYKDIVGSLNYVMTCTRPDLCYIVSMTQCYLIIWQSLHLLT